MRDRERQVEEGEREPNTNLPRRARVELNMTFQNHKQLKSMSQ